MLNDVNLGEKLALRVEEAGKLLSLGRTKLYDLVAQGELRTIRVGRRILVPRDALEQFLRERSA